MSGDVVHTTRSALPGANGSFGVRQRIAPGEGASGAFTPRQLARIDEALTFATRESDLLFSLFVGDLDEPTRATAEEMHVKLGVNAPSAVLIAVSPGQRVLHIVTGAEAAERIPNRVAALAALSMRAAFSAGDLTGGIVNGIRMLSDAAGVRPNR
ncbi:MAG: uncharacterized protein JWN20_2614 [Jatrophihabitantaceae bacterium]|nr:uncharacterized protein [Jatrophihabitantaceae bacterium]